VIRAGGGKEVASTDPNTAPTPTPVAEQLKEDKDKKEDEKGEKDKPPSSPKTSTPAPKQGDKPTQVKDPEGGLLEKALVFLRSQSLSVKIAIGVGVFVLIVALGLTIWQVVEISLGNESILDLISGGGQPGKTELELQIEAAKERLALRNSRLKATGLATAGAFCLGIGLLLLGGIAFISIIAGDPLKEIKNSIAILIPGVILLLVGIFGIVVAEALGSRLFGAYPNHIFYLAIGAGFAVGFLIFVGWDDVQNTDDLEDHVPPPWRIVPTAVGVIFAVSTAIFSFVLPYFSTPTNSFNMFIV
jgi:hypothetical protein